MKFEEFLMRPSQDQRRRLALENEVEELQQRLEGEVKLKSVLRWAMKGPVLSFHCLPPEIPFKVKVLLTELAVAEEQIIWLERKVRKLKLNLNHHKTCTSQPNITHQNSGNRTLDDIIFNGHGIATYTGRGNSELNLMSRRNQSFSSSRLNATFLFSSPWRRNALCGN